MSVTKAEAKTETLMSLVIMTEVLMRDVEHARALCRHSSSPRTRRNYVRTVFSMFEGMIFRLKRVALLRAADSLFSGPELALLREERYFLDEKGRAHSRVDWPPFQPNLVFAFTAFARSQGLPQLEGAAVAILRRRQFARALAVRNRVTHPKTPDDLQVTDHDLSDVKSASDLFSQLLHILLTEAQAITADGGLSAKERRALNMHANAEIRRLSTGLRARPQHKGRGLTRA